MRMHSQLFCFLLFPLLSFRCSPRLVNDNPLESRFITDDLVRFEQAYTLLNGLDDVETLEEYYIKPGTPGLDDFVKGKIYNAASLSMAINMFPGYYAELGSLQKRIEEKKEEILEGMDRLKLIYPEARFPDIYFLTGAMNCGGTISEDAIIIGAEFFAKTENTDMEELTEWHRKVLSTPDDLPALVIHELVHIQQQIKTRDLLSTAIMEGSADFITELIMGTHPNKKIHEFADKREYYLWREFQTKMYSKDFSGWLYSDADNRPHDLGYWIGYKITKAYYMKQQDKRQAIVSILTIDDFNNFLTQSGYNGIP